MPRRRARTERGRVLIVVQNLPVPADRRVWLECQALVAAGHQVSVICPKGPGDPSRQVLDGVHLLKYRPAPATHGVASFLVEFVYCWLRTFALALRVAVRPGFDVLQACNPPDTYFVLGWLFKLAGKRFVYDQHDLCPEVYASRFEQPSDTLLRLLHRAEVLTYRTADHVIATNESYRTKAIVRGRVSPDDVTIVRSGPDPDRMRRGTPRPDLRRGRSHLACYLGVMGPQDGVDLLLRAVHVYVHDLGRHDCHFALLGSGDCWDDLRALVHDLGLDEYVTMPGWADDRMIHAYLSTADVGLSPDPKNPLNDLCTMNKTLEYMAYELPVVAFDLTETRVSAQDAAVYVEPNDVTAFAVSLAYLLDDRDRQATMQRVGRTRIEAELSWHHQAPQYVGVYERLTGTAAAPGPGT